MLKTAVRQVPGHDARSSPGPAVHHNSRVSMRFKVREPKAHLLEGDTRGAGEMAAVELIMCSTVQQQGGVLALLHGDQFIAGQLPRVGAFHRLG